MGKCGNENDLKTATETYWNQLSDNPNDQIQVLKTEYIPKILPCEMALVKKPSQDEIDACDKLVFLVGHSIEPILQSVCVYSPKEVFLVTNQMYGERLTGNDQADYVKDLILELHKYGFTYIDRGNIHPVLLKGDQPADVYHALQQNLQNTTGFLMDITGAKKSIVVGAFLFAALAGISISYVDFPDDAYDSVRRRPYGYRAVIRKLSNPLDDFALSDWERVRTWYQRHRYRDARSLLVGEPNNAQATKKETTILEKTSAYLPQSKDAISRLADILECYELWESGNYNEAVTAADKIPEFNRPAGVSILGGKWVRIEGVDFKLPPMFYADEEMLKAYAYDELERIKRLEKYNQDYRSAFLRAAGLTEIINVARLVKRIAGDQDRQNALTKLTEGTTPNASKAFCALATGNRLTWNTVDYPPSQRMFGWWKSLSGKSFTAEDGWKTFLKYRNKLAHAFVSVPRDWASEAIEFVEANIDDFWPIKPDAYCSSALSWADVCKRCGLDKFLPPQLLISDTADGDGEEENQNG